MYYTQSNQYVLNTNVENTCDVIDTWLKRLNSKDMTIECRHLLKSYNALQYDIKSKLQDVFEEVLASVSQSAWPVQISNREWWKKIFVLVSVIVSSVTFTRPFCQVISRVVSRNWVHNHAQVFHTNYFVTLQYSTFLSTLFSDTDF